LFDKLEESLRVTLIVSDDDGYDMVSSMISGLNWNKSIWGIVIRGETEKAKELAKECEKYNKKMEKAKKLLMVFHCAPCADDDD
jgi:hypothetical protein